MPCSHWTLWACPWGPPMYMCGLIPSLPEPRGGCPSVGVQCPAPRQGCRQLPGGLRWQQACGVPRVLEWPAPPCPLSGGEAEVGPGTRPGPWALRQGGWEAGRVSTGGLPGLLGAGRTLQVQPGRAPEPPSVATAQAGSFNYHSLGPLSRDNLGPLRAAQGGAPSPRGPGTGSPGSHVLPAPIKASSAGLPPH